MPKFYPFRKAYRGLKKVFTRRPKKSMKQKSNVKNGLVHFKKTVIDPRINVVNGLTTFGSDTFELSDIPQYLSYVGLYEEYRIDKITYSFKSLTNIATGPATAVGNTFTSLGMIHSIIDINDSLVPTTIQDMMNDSTYKGTRSSRNHTRTFVPSWLNVVGGGVSSQSKTGWLNTASPGISHYCLKWAFEGGAGIPAYYSFSVEPIITYYISFRNPK